MLKSLSLTLCTLSIASSSLRSKPKARRLLMQRSRSEPLLPTFELDGALPQSWSYPTNLDALYQEEPEEQQTEEQLEAPDQMDEQHEKSSPLQKDIIRYHLTTGKSFAKHQQIFDKLSIIQPICKKLTNGLEF